MRRGLVTLLLGTIAVATGCSAITPKVQAEDCSRFAEAEIGAQSSHTVVMVDRSNSTRSATPDGMVVDVVEVLEDVREDVLQRRDVVSIGSFDGAATSVRWTARRMSTDGGRENEANRDADIEAARSCFDQAIAEAVDAPPEQTGTDIVGALVMAREELAESTGPKRVVLVTDGLASAGCADMSRLRIGQADIVPHVRRLCAERDDALPGLEGVQVSMLGVGHPAQGERQPRTGHLGWLSDFWLGVCEEAKAEICQVSIAPVDMTEARNRRTVPEVADLAVEYGPEPAGLPARRVIRIPGEILFTQNSTAISDRGERALEQVAAGVRLDTPVQVHGYTEAQSTTENNRALAKGRAEAVRDVLASHGLDRVTAEGHAGRAPSCPAGQDPSARQCTRRVDIVVGE